MAFTWDYESVQARIYEDKLLSWEDVSMETRLISQENMAHPSSWNRKQPSSKLHRRRFCYLLDWYCWHDRQSGKVRQVPTLKTLVGWLIQVQAVRHRTMPLNRSRFWWHKSFFPQFSGGFTARSTTTFACGVWRCQMLKLLLVTGMLFLRYVQEINGKHLKIAWAHLEWIAWFFY